MNSKDVKLQRAAQAQFLKLTSGLSDKVIAAQLNVSTKTISRDLQVELPAEMQEAIDTATAEFREAFVSKAQPIAMQLLDRLEEQIEGKELKPRDTIIGLGVVTDKLRSLQPQPTTVTETKKLRITYTTPDGKSGTLLDGIKYAGDEK